MASTRNKKWSVIFAGALLVLSLIVVIALLPGRDICSDDIRGFEREASSSLEAIRTKLESIKASARVQEIYNVPQLKDLNAANFAALRACDSQCKLLSQCLRFVYFRPPSEACPTEYNDYKATTKSASEILGKLQQVETQTNQVAAKVEDLSRIERSVAELEKTSSSTGGRLAILQAEARRAKVEISQDLMGVSDGLNELSAPQRGN